MPDLADLLAQAEPDPRAVENSAAEAFGRFKRTDMRSGVANMIRRIAQLSEAQPISPTGWDVLRDGAKLLDRADVTPAEIRALDERLRAAGLDVDRKAQT